MTKFFEYFLISFKTEKQGDSIKTGNTINPDTGMKHIERDLEEVIEEIYWPNW